MNEVPSVSVNSFLADCAYDYAEKLLFKGSSLKVGVRDEEHRRSFETGKMY